ncbi:IPT/TIG domain-containing protein [Candidatus Nitrospira bockiana]
MDQRIDQRSGLRAGAVAGVMLLVFAAMAAEAASKSAPPASVANAPTCDPSAHPKITKVTPDTVKPGEKVTIKGRNFGTKQCFNHVSFGSSNATFTYVNDTTLEATVPAMKSGLTPVNVMTQGGTSQFVVLIQGK